MPNSKFQILNSKYAGSALLLSLLVLSGVVVTGFAVGDLLLRDFIASRRADEGTVAFYAAESGIEQGLYRIRKTDAVFSSLQGGQALPNGSRFERSASDEVPSLILSLQKEDSYTVDMFDPDNPAVGGGIDSLVLTWEDTCGGCSWIEAGYVEWTPSASINWTENFTNIRYPAAASPVTIGAISSDKAYRLRFTAHYGDVRNLVVRAFSGDPGAPTPIKHAVITMNSVGKFGKTAQTMQAAFLRQAPLQKIFDFVAFTECSLVKDGVSECP
ncbi:hypothetical protein HYT45_03700 [Candidatus Uhrbacteria bacterium]|nr:hypothetical protein [Candidatus Uhrbacteria bacterium]